MADGVVANAGSGGATFATDDIGGTHYPISKLAFGPLDTATIVSTSNGLPVSIVNTSIAVTDNGGSLTVDGTVAATQSGTWTVTQSGTWNVGTVTAVTSITNPVAATQSGTWNITNVSGTISLPTGAATAAKQPALGTAGTASSDVLTVQGIASMTALKVDGSAVTQPVSDGGGSLTVDGTVAATQSGTWNVGTVTTLTSVTNPVAITDNSGSLTVDDGGSSLTVDGTVAATQSGSWTVTANAGTGTLTTTNSSIGTGGSAAPTAATQIGAKVSTNMQVLTGTNTAPGFYALHCDVRAFGGTIGQTIASLSMPVAIASDQSVIPTSQDSATLYAGTTALTPKFAVVTASSSGDTSVIAAVTSKKIRVIRYSLSANGNVSAYFRSGAGGTAISGVKYMTQYGGAGGTYCPQGIFETGSNTALVINLNGAIAVSGEITYLEV